VPQSSLEVETVDFSRKLLPSYQTTRRHIGRAHWKWRQ